MLRKFGVSRKCQLRRNECDDLPTVQEKLEDVFLGGARGKHVDSVRLLWRCAVVVGFYTDQRPANDTEPAGCVSLTLRRSMTQNRPALCQRVCAVYGYVYRYFFITDST